MNAAVPSFDAIDVLLGQGVPTSEMVEVSQLQYIKSSKEEITTFLVFVGVINIWLFVLSVSNHRHDADTIFCILQIACWALVCPFFPRWMESKAEVDAFVNKHDEFLQ